MTPRSPRQLANNGIYRCRFTRRFQRKNGPVRELSPTEIEQRVAAAKESSDVERTEEPKG